MCVSGTQTGPLLVGFPGFTMCASRCVQLHGNVVARQARVGVVEDHNVPDFDVCCGDRHMEPQCEVHTYPLGRHLVDHWGVMQLSAPGVWRGLFFRKNRGADPRRNVWCFFVCFVEPKCTPWTTLLAFWRCHAVGFPGVPKNQFLERQSYHSGGFFSGRKNKTKQQFSAYITQREQQKRQLVACPGIFGLLCSVGLPGTLPSLSQDPPALPGTLLGHSQDSAGLLPESSGDPLPGKPAKGLSRKGNIIRPAFRNGRTSCFVPLESVIFWQKRSLGVVWCVMCREGGD